MNEVHSLDAVFQSLERILPSSETFLRKHQNPLQWNQKQKAVVRRYYTALFRKFELVEKEYPETGIDGRSRLLVTAATHHIIGLQGLLGAAKHKVRRIVLDARDDFKTAQDLFGRVKHYGPKDEEFVRTHQEDLYQGPDRRPIKELLEQIMPILQSEDRVSIAMIQQHLRVSFLKAELIMDILEQRGTVVPADD